MEETQNAEMLQEPIVLSAEESSALDEGLRSEQNDRIYTLEEAMEFARQRRKQWARVPAAVSG